MSNRTLSPILSGRGFQPDFRGFFAPRRALLVLGLGVLLLAACDRNVEPYREGEEPSEPDLARIFPGPPGGVGTAEAEPEAGIPRNAVPPSRAQAGAPSGAAATDGEAAPIQGQIDIAPELAASRPADGVLFVIARSQGARGGPPLAVLRIASPSFPVAFEIGPENVMIPSLRFAGAISLSARLDADGNAMTRGAEDLSSAIEEPLSPGAEGVRLLLSERG